MKRTYYQCVEGMKGMVAELQESLSLRRNGEGTNTHTTLTIILYLSIYTVLVVICLSLFTGPQERGGGRETGTLGLKVLHELQQLVSHHGSWLKDTRVQVNEW